MTDIDPNLLSDGSDPDMDDYIHEHMPQSEPPAMAITENPFALGVVVIPDVGGYDVFAVMDDGDVLCRSCVLDPTNPVHDLRIIFAQADMNRDGWGVIGFDHTGSLESPEHCAHCNEEIG